MKNPIILITSSSEEEEEGGGGRTVRWRSKLEEYSMISDLKGFENLKAMLEAEACMRKKKRKRRKANTESCGPKEDHEFSINAAEEKEQLSRGDGLGRVEVSKLEEDEEEGGGRRGECGGNVRWRSRLEEYKIISDLKGFENLKAMLEAEAGVSTKKRKKKKGKIESRAQKEDEVTVHAAKKKEQLSKDEALERVEVSKPESVLTSQNDDPQNPIIGAAKEKEDSGSVEIIEITSTKGADDGVNSAEVIDLCLSSSEADQRISGVCVGSGSEVTMPFAAVARKKNKRRRRKKASKVDGAKEDDAKDNIVLRRLLRGPRYFDFPDCSWETCSNCGNENHRAKSCTAQKQKKPCFLCGSSEHIWKYCLQGQDCFIGQGRNQEDSLSHICLKCGDSGHDMFSCRSDYPADDIKKIQCYICKSLGHLWCANVPDSGLKQVSCYKCGESGHLGSECTMSCEGRGATKPSFCYKCGEEGHFARRCGSYVKDRLRISDLLSTAEGHPNKTRNHKESSSNTHNRCKAQGRGNDHTQEKNNCLQNDQGGWTNT